MHTCIQHQQTLKHTPHTDEWLVAKKIISIVVGFFVFFFSFPKSLRIANLAFFFVFFFCFAFSARSIFSLFMKNAALGCVLN